MSFAWPKALAALALVPLLVAGYVHLVRRRARRARELAAQGFAPNAAAARRRWRRHVPFAFFLTALALLLASLARPQMTLELPRREGTVVLAFDVSNSMLATDLQPNRMDAAKAAAKAFVDEQPSSIRVGLVAFSDGGVVTQPPTDVRADVVAAIERLAPQGATSLGQGLFAALNAIAGKPIVLDEAAQQGDFSNVDVGYFGSAAVVLFTDGENTARPDPLQVAELAATAGVKVYPIGLGSPEGAVVEVGGFSLATRLDEALLTQVADVTDGTYYRAQDTAALADVYDRIDLRIVARGERTEVTGVVAGLSALLLVIGAGLSLAWFGRVV
jgi:Ca-activated chloride channel family protein